MFFIVHEYSIHFCFIPFIKFVILSYTFLAISFARDKEYMICLEQKCYSQKRLDHDKKVCERCT